MTLGTCAKQPGKKAALGLDQNAANQIQGIAANDHQGPKVTNPDSQNREYDWGTDWFRNEIKLFCHSSALVSAALARNIPFVQRPSAQACLWFWCW